MLGLDERSPVRKANQCEKRFAPEFEDSLMKSIQVSWPHDAAALSIVLGTAGCAMNAPEEERGL